MTGTRKLVSRWACRSSSEPDGFPGGDVPQAHPTAHLMHAKSAVCQLCLPEAVRRLTAPTAPAPSMHRLQRTRTALKTPMLTECVVTRGTGSLRRSGDMARGGFKFLYRD